MKSAGVTYPCRCDTDHSRDISRNTIGYSTIVYGTAKKPLTAPEAHMAAGTATNVYAVYRSPPSRNQVTQVPNPRPPRPHSSRVFRPRSAGAVRQRDARKPTMATATNRTTTMISGIHSTGRFGATGEAAV